MTTVTMGRLRLRLHAQEQHAELLQNRCSSWFRSHLERELSTLLTDYASMDIAPKTIDRLTLSVGDIPLSQFESQMSERVMTLLKQRLLTLPAYPRLGAEGHVPGAEGHVLGAKGHALAGPAQRETQRDTTSGSTRETAASTSPAMFAQLLRYLDTGVGVDARLWLSREARDAWLREVLEGALPTSTLGEAGKNLPPRVALALRMLQPRARQRLVTTWSEQVRVLLATWLIAPNRLPDMAPSDASWMLPLAALIALQRHPVTSDYVEALPVVSVPNAALSALWLDASDERDAVSSMANEAVSKVPGETERGHSGLRTFNTWIAALLHAPLPVSLHAPLLGWLCDPAHARLLTARLAALSASVRQQLRTTLGGGAPLRQNRSPHVIEATSPGIAAPGIDVQTAGRQETTAFEADTPWVVANAGLVLLWPLLPRLFSTFGWLADGRFVDEQARWQAVGCLDWLAWGDPELAEWRTPCARLLCGLAWETPFVACPPSVLRQAELDLWLGQALASVPLLDRCSISDLRIFFLQRAGTLVDAPMRLTIEPEALDVLLCKLPWPLTNVMLPWLSIPISVDWNS